MSYDTLILARQTSTRNRNRNRSRMNPCKCQRQCPESRVSKSGKRQTRKYMYGIKDPEEEVRKANDTKRNKTRRNEMKRTEPKCAREIWKCNRRGILYFSYFIVIYSLYLIPYTTISHIFYLSDILCFISHFVAGSETKNDWLKLKEGGGFVFHVLQPSHLMRFISVFNSFVTLLCFCLHLPRSPSLHSTHSTHN